MLPKTKTTISKSPEDYTILLYGDPKIGKTTFCSQSSNALFLSTEAGTNALEIFEIKVKDWSHFKECLNALVEEEHEYEHLIIDTVDILYRMCADYVCEEQGIKHEAELEFGKGYHLVNLEFQTVITKMCKIGLGVIFVSHAKEYEHKTRTGSITKSIPTLPASCMRFLTGLVDIILYAESIKTGDGEERIINTKPSENFMAGDRTGKIPVELPLDYKTFKKEFEKAIGGKK